MKKKQITNYLKTGIFFVGVSLLFWGCEKNEVNKTFEPQNIIEKIQQSFSKEDFVKSIPYDFEVNWDLVEKEYSEELKTDYYEFPIKYTSALTPHLNDLKKTKGDYFKSYKIVVTVKEENINFYVLRVYEKISEASQIISEINFNYSSSFNGLIHLVDKNDEIVFAKKIEKGAELIKDYFAKDLKDLDPIKSRAPEGCVTVRTEHWYYYYQWSQDVEVFLYSKKLLDITYEQICAYDYLPEYDEGMTNPDGGGAPSGAGTYKTDCSPNNTGSKSKYFSRESENCAIDVTEEVVECEKGFVMNSDGNCVESIVVDSPDNPISDINEYLKCFDLTKEASITIYALEPNPGSGDANNGTMVGHTFISLGQGNETRTFGFYPVSDNIYPLVNVSSDSVLGDDGVVNHNFSARVTKTITSTQLMAIIDKAKNYNKTYNLNTYNCTDFAIELGNLGGLNLPDSYGTWLGGGGSNPGALGMHIRGLNPSNNNVNITGGLAPKTNKGC
ncbi:hypothetical protein [Polaribacter gochangensis]|uniref:hypothetical protein n=1 Tax=Polaribacter gochangensis TaxID=3252903 RepID=UPI003904C93A